MKLNQVHSRTEDGVPLNCHGHPIPGKAAKFTASAEDTYCCNVETLVGFGLKNKKEENYILLYILGLGEALRSYDKYDYALPYDQCDIKKMNKDFNIDKP